jgi:hypothetical protein
MHRRSPRTAISRRHAIKAFIATTAAAGVLVAFTRPAFAGSYLDRAGLLVREGRSETDYLEFRLDNKELAELLHKLATARLAFARDMLIPKEVTQAHPHLLLMLEDCERAADAAQSGERTRFVVFQRKARDEEQMFRSIMRQFGFPLEDEKKK